MEANEEKRSQYKKWIKDLEQDKLVYIDESGLEILICKDRGWEKKGDKLLGKKSGQYDQRTNSIAGYVNHQSIAPVVFNGSCNRVFFETWVEKVLIKELKPGQRVIMDNASLDLLYILQIGS